MSLDEVVAKVGSGELDAAAWALSLHPIVARQLEERIVAARELLPVPIGPSADGEGVARRRLLDQLLGELRARRGDHALRLEVERARWLRGGSHVRYVEALLDAGKDSEAASLARTLLAREVGGETAGLEVFLAKLSSPPEGWETEVAALAEDPTVERWDSLFQFAPADLRAERRRYTLYLLRRVGVPFEQLFELASRDGITSDAASLVEEGLVDTRAIERRARDADPVMRPMWLGLAARGACVRGDRLGAVRLLRAALAEAPRSRVVVADLAFVRKHADLELGEMLDCAGLP